MHFDPDTKTFSGRLREITPEERAYLDEQVRMGRMISTEHPSWEEMAAANERRAKRSFNEGLYELLKERGYPV